MQQQADGAHDEESLLPGGANAGFGQMQAMSKKFPVKMNLMFFSAACCVLAAGFIGTLDLLFTSGIFAPTDLIDEIYLLFFGLIMFVLDAPLSFKLILEVKQHVYKYARFLTRFTGRGIWYIFLGTTTWATLWENSISKFLAVFLGFFVMGVGLFSAVMGYIKSRKLERVRYQVFQQKQAQKLETLYRAFAKSTPSVGLNKHEFNDLCVQLKGIQFEQEELTYVFNALTNGPRSENVTLEDLDEWCTGTMTLL